MTLHIRWEAFESAWKRLRTRKAPGLDGIPGEVLAATGILVAGGLLREEGAGWRLTPAARPRA